MQLHSTQGGSLTIEISKVGNVACTKGSDLARKKGEKGKECEKVNGH